MALGRDGKNIGRTLTHAILVELKKSTPTDPRPVVR